MSSPPSESPPFIGLVPAVFTPFDDAGEVDFGRIPEVVDFLVGQGVSGLYICGSTGEAPSLTAEERREVAEAYVMAAKGRVRTIVQIGHTSLAECRRFGEHAADVGADAISAIAPYYYPVESPELLVDFFREAAGSAPELPFYYYHIPMITGPVVDPRSLLALAAAAIPNLRGLKFTDSDLSVLEGCMKLQGGRFDCLFGRDEMLLPALAMGVKGAVGSTYNFAPALYRRILEAVANGRWEEAREWQARAVEMIDRVYSLGGLAALKAAMKAVGQSCGRARLPLRQLSAADEKGIREMLGALDFQTWACGS